MTDLLARATALSPARRMLLARRLRARVGDEEAQSTQAARLVAYYVCAPGEAVDERALTDYLEDRLPDYMVPTALVRLDAIPRTPGGKVDRRALPEPRATGSPPGRAGDAPRNERERTLAKIWCEVLGTSYVGIHDDFFELGGDSILSIRIIAKANQARLSIAPESFFDHPTVAGLAAIAGESAASASAREVLGGAIPLTPIQHWFFEHHRTEPEHWNQAMLLETDAMLDAGTVESALRAVLGHHDALRAVFSAEGSAWRQTLLPADFVPPVGRVDLSDTPEEGRAAAIDAVVTGLHRDLRLASGGLVRAASVQLGRDRGTVVILVAHHLVIDAYSWPIVIEDFAQACSTRGRGESAALPPKTSSFGRWSEALRDLAASGDLESEENVWASMRPSVPPPFDWDGDAPENRVRDAATITRVLDEGETRALRQGTAQALRASVEEILLAALACSIARWTGGERVHFGLERHGREPLFPDVDVSRTVGWFTSFFPVDLIVPPGADPVDTLVSTKEHMRALPRQGIGFGVLRYLSPRRETRARLERISTPWLAFNFLGTWELPPGVARGFRLTTGPTATARSPDGPRAFLIEVNALIAGGRLEVTWTYAARAYRSATVDALADGFVDAVRSLLSRAATGAGEADAPSDFPLAGLDRDELARVSDLLDGGDG